MERLSHLQTTPLYLKWRRLETAGIEPASAKMSLATSTCVSGYFFRMSPSSLGPQQAAVESSSREHREKRTSHTLIGCHYPDTHRGSAVMSSSTSPPRQARELTPVLLSCQSHAALNSGELNNLASYSIMEGFLRGQPYHTSTRSYGSNQHVETSTSPFSMNKIETDRVSRSWIPLSGLTTPSHEIRQFSAHPSGQGATGNPPSRPPPVSDRETGTEKESPSASGTRSSSPCYRLYWGILLSSTSLGQKVPPQHVRGLGPANSRIRQTREFPELTLSPMMRY